MSCPFDLFSRSSSVSSMFFDSSTMLVKPLCHTRTGCPVERSSELSADGSARGSLCLFHCSERLLTICETSVNKISCHRSSSDTRPGGVLVTDSTVAYNLNVPVGYPLKTLSRGFVRPC